jgi:succinate dehydrogenase/fumarate reductase cytochrome b subunit (b558 family)
VGRKLFSLAGIVPLAFFLIEHTWANASALNGQDAYVATAVGLEHIPLLGLLEVLFVFAPLAYHALYGLWMMRSGLPENAPPYGRRLAITNRVAAMAALVYIAWHFWELRVQAWRGLDPHAFYATLVWRLSSTWHGFPVRAVLYLIGITATVAHLAISAWGYGVTTGYFTNKRQKRRAAYACAAIGALLFVVSTSTVVSLATGLEFSPARRPAAPCTPQK